MDADEVVFPSPDSVGSIETEANVLQNLQRSEDKRFLKGVAISLWQNSGDADSNWTRFVKERRCCGLRGTISDGTTDTFPDTWNRYKEDIALLKEMNCNAFRFSLEWARIEPEEGKYDTDAILRYNEIFDCLDEHGMVPFVTLHHFVHPGWFHDRGGFEKRENVPLFVGFCVKAFKTFGHRAVYWATFNEPTIYTYFSYTAGVHAPGATYQHVSLQQPSSAERCVFGRYRLTGKVLMHLLQAHCIAYKEMKKVDRGKDCQIGIVHASAWVVPAGQSIIDIAAKYVSEWMTHWLGRDLIVNFFKTGRFIWKIPLMGTVLGYTYPDGRPPCDWWGINYYSRTRLGWTLKPSAGDEIMTDMDYPLYPRGLYQSIKAGSCLGLPIYITETGIPDAKDDRRHLMIKGYTNELVRAIKHGFDVRGMFYWTLVDNFEWNLGYQGRFGLYEFNPEKGIDRKLREKAKVLQAIYRRWPATREEMYRYARATVIPSFSAVLRERNEDAEEFKARTTTTTSGASGSS